jgi:hypothetical protein
MAGTEMPGLYNGFQRTSNRLRGHAQIEVFDWKATKLLSFGREGGRPGEFFVAGALAGTTDDDTMYVCDEWNHRVEVFDRRGFFVRMWGSRGTANGQFEEPRGIRLLRERVFVADTTCLQAFHTTGTFLWAVQGYVASLEGLTTIENTLALCDAEGIVYVFAADGTRLRKCELGFDSYGIFTSVNGEFLYITSPSHNIASPPDFGTVRRVKNFEAELKPQLSAHRTLRISCAYP